MQIYRIFSQSINREELNMIKKYTNKEINEIRRKIFSEVIEPSFLEQGFTKTEHNFSQYDYVPGIGYVYELFKSIENNKLVRISIKIINGEQIINISLNIFEDDPNSIEFALQELNGKEERLDVGFLKTIPLLSPRFWFGDYRVPRYSFGSDKKIEKLKSRLKNDIGNINYYIDQWFKIHK